MEGHSSTRSSSSSSSTSYLQCSRQSSSRWIPTPEQIRILRELYYINGVRSPTAEQIQRITARLRQYGKIEGKNVFYWFQNHKARERQKKKLTTTTINNIDPITTNNAKLTSTTHLPHYAGLAAANGCYGAVREAYSIVDRTEPAMPWMYHYIKEEEEAVREIETLPLFPTHCKGHEEEEEAAGKYFGSNEYFTGMPAAACYYTANGAAAAAAASLELTLNSYYCAPPGSM